MRAENYKIAKSAASKCQKGHVRLDNNKQARRSGEDSCAS